MTLAEIQAILNAPHETPEGKTILIMQLVSGVMNTHANAVFEGTAALDRGSLHTTATAMLIHAAYLLTAAKVAATAPSSPTFPS